MWTLLEMIEFLMVHPSPIVTCPITIESAIDTLAPIVQWLPMMERLIWILAPNLHPAATITSLPIRLARSLGSASSIVLSIMGILDGSATSSSWCHRGMIIRFTSEYSWVVLARTQSTSASPGSDGSTCPRHRTSTDLPPTAGAPSSTFCSAAARGDGSSNEVNCFLTRNGRSSPLIVEIERSSTTKSITHLAKMYRWASSRSRWILNRGCRDSTDLRMARVSSGRFSSFSKRISFDDRGSIPT
mmetsp:Transcript_16739/g.43439  ORF Transcript_16739/g.43439 Transcript_16739/m.43439 type:complete len:244 (+) Transcript_16739:237-968(+)